MNDRFINNISLCASGYNHNQELGTSFGRKTDFKTEQIDFDKGDMIEKIVVFYDSKSNLIKKGIIKSYIKKEPNPFPGNYCKPPEKWQD